MISTPLLGQRVHVVLDRVDLVLEDHRGAGAGGFGRIRGQRRDEADLNTVHVENDRVLDLGIQRVVLAQIEIAGQHGEIDCLQEPDEVIGAVVEFVVADRHSVEADGLP
jgi:hypothetical protein